MHVLSKRRTTDDCMYVRLVTPIFTLSSSSYHHIDETIVIIIIVVVDVFVIESRLRTLPRENPTMHIFSIDGGAGWWQIVFVGGARRHRRRSIYRLAAASSSPLKLGYLDARNWWHFARQGQPLARRPDDVIIARVAVRVNVACVVGVLLFFVTGKRNLHGARPPADKQIYERQCDHRPQLCDSLTWGWCRRRERRIWRQNGVTTTYATTVPTMTKRVAYCSTTLRTWDEGATRTPVVLVGDRVDLETDRRTDGRTDDQWVSSADAAVSRDFGLDGAQKMSLYRCRRLQLLLLRCWRRPHDGASVTRHLASPAFAANLVCDVHCSTTTTF